LQSDAASTALAVAPNDGGLHRIGIDIGGTFADAVAVDGAGNARTTKVLAVRGLQDESVLQAVARLEVDLADTGDLVHGSTVAINTLLERRGAKLGMVVTAGFRDVYEIGRANRRDMYTTHYARPQRLLQRRDIFEVAERISADGDVVQELDVVAARELAMRLKESYEAVAVCFLNSYREGAHELAMQAILQEVAPELTVVCSHLVAAEHREFERWTTCLVAGFVAPPVQRYLGRLESRLDNAGHRGNLLVMQSNGGAMTARAEPRSVVQTLFSGPVGGTVACAALGRAAGELNLICLDMGGTSTDVSLVVDGATEVQSEIEVDGHPILIPAVHIESIGAGGGSIARMSDGGLRVGPQSAGASPGPACYGRGGTEPTVTDANVLLGRIPAIARLGGTLALDGRSAEEAMDRVAAQLGLTRIGLAEGVVTVANSLMANAIRELTVGRGIDPRGFALLAFGGAGPLHAVAIAEELDIPRVIVPRDAGVLSAWGMVNVDLRYDYVQTFAGHLSTLDRQELGGVVASLSEEGRVALDREGVDPSKRRLIASADLRYVGQEYTLNVVLPETFTASSVSALAVDFASAHLTRYGHNNPDEEVEVVHVRLAAIGVREPTMPPALAAKGEIAPLTATEVVFNGAPHRTFVYSREAFGNATSVTGPCVIVEDGSTTLLPPGWSATASRAGHLFIERIAE
jgi:N-methylhydantoinase A